MAKRIRIDCYGMKSPEPVIKIAQAARTYPPATVLAIQSDDMKLERDVREWAGTVKATILRIEKGESNLLIELQLPG